LILKQFTLLFSAGGDCQLPTIRLNYASCHYEAHWRQMGSIWEV